MGHFPKASSFYSSEKSATKFILVKANVLPFKLLLQDGLDLAKRRGIVTLSMAMFCENKIDNNVTTKRIVYQTF